MTLDDALVAFSFGPAPDIKICIIIKEFNCNDIASLVFAFLESGKLGNFPLRACAGLPEMTYLSLVACLFLLVVKTELQSRITIFLHSLDL